MVKVLEDSSAELVGLLQDGRRDAGLGLRQEGREPLAVDVDAVFDGLVLAEGQGQAVADDLHEPDDLRLAGQRRRLGILGRG